MRQRQAKRNMFNCNLSTKLTDHNILTINERRNKENNETSHKSGQF